MCAGGGGRRSLTSPSPWYRWCQWTELYSTMAISKRRLRRYSRRWQYRSEGAGYLWGVCETTEGGLGTWDTLLLTVVELSVWEVHSMCWWTVSTFVAICYYLCVCVCARVCRELSDLRDSSRSERTCGFVKMHR